MQSLSRSLRSKFVVASVLVAACVLAAPAAMAHAHYQRHGDHTADVVGALVVGAVIGGVLVSASQHHDDYYQGRDYYPPRPYAPVGYNTYSAYPYRGSVNIGVVYSNGGHYYRGYQGRRDHRYDRRGHDRGQHGYYRGYHRH